MRHQDYLIKKWKLKDVDKKLQDINDYLLSNGEFTLELPTEMIRVKRIENN